MQPPSPPTGNDVAYARFAVVRPSWQAIAPEWARLAAAGVPTASEHLQAGPGRTCRPLMGGGCAFAPEPHGEVQAGPSPQKPPWQHKCRVSWPSGYGAEPACHASAELTDRQLRLPDRLELSHRDKLRALLRELHRAEEEEAVQMGATALLSTTPAGPTEKRQRTSSVRLSALLKAWAAASAAASAGATLRKRLASEGLHCAATSSKHPCELRVRARSPDALAQPDLKLGSDIDSGAECELVVGPSVGAMCAAAGGGGKALRLAYGLRQLEEPRAYLAQAGVRVAARQEHLKATSDASLGVGQEASPEFLRQLRRPKRAEPPAQRAFRESLETAAREPPGPNDCWLQPPAEPDLPAQVARVARLNDLAAKEKTLIEEAAHPEIPRQVTEAEEEAQRVAQAYRDTPGAAQLARLKATTARLKSNLEAAELATLMQDYDQDYDLREVEDAAMQKADADARSTLREKAEERASKFASRRKSPFVAALMTAELHTELQEATRDARASDSDMRPLLLKEAADRVREPDADAETLIVRARAAHISRDLEEVRRKQEELKLAGSGAPAFFSCGRDPVLERVKGLTQAARPSLWRERGEDLLRAEEFLQGEQPGWALAPPPAPTVVASREPGDETLGGETLEEADEEALPLLRCTLDSADDECRLRTTSAGARATEDRADGRCSLVLQPRGPLCLRSVADVTHALGRATRLRDVAP